MTALDVRNEQVRTLYSQSLPVLFANVANAMIVSAALWSFAPHRVLLGWTGLMAAMTLGRAWLRHRYWREHPDPAQAGKWGARFVAGTAVAGVLWGAAGLLFFDVGGTLSRTLIGFAIGGMGAGAAATLSCYAPAFWAYLVPALLPLTLRTLFGGDTLHLALGTMMGVYGLALSMVARTAGRSITEAFRLRLELASAQLTLEHTNRTLEARVVERTGELERKSVALRDAQRMEAVGRLAGGIAHDFNNLLTIVHSNVEILSRDPRLDPVSRSVVEDLRTAATRGADLVRQLLAFSRRQKLAPRVVDLQELVVNMGRLLSRLVGETIELTVSSASDQLLVMADPSQLEQVVVNLVTNARDAMSGGGRIAVATSAIEADGSAGLPAGSYAMLSVSDTGVGMDPEIQRRVFEPFFTTKEVGQGTGLGLATVYGIVDQSGGQVSVESRPGEGSVFRVFFLRVVDSAGSQDDGAAGRPTSS